MVAVISALNAWIGFTLLDAVDRKDAATAHVLGALGINSWVPFMVGSAVLLLSVGLGGLRTAVLPKWLAIVTIVLGVCCLLGPTGFASGSRCRSGASRSAWRSCAALRRARRPRSPTRSPSEPSHQPGQVDSIWPGCSGLRMPITIVLAATTRASPTSWSGSRC